MNNLPGSHRGDTRVSAASGDIRFSSLRGWRSTCRHRLESYASAQHRQAPSTRAKDSMRSLHFTRPGKLPLRHPVFMLPESERQSSVLNRERRSESVISTSRPDTSSRNPQCVPKQPSHIFPGHEPIPSNHHPYQTHQGGRTTSSRARGANPAF